MPNWNATKIDSNEKLRFSKLLSNEFIDFGNIFFCFELSTENVSNNVKKMCEFFCSVSKFFIECEKSFDFVWIFFIKRKTSDVYVEITDGIAANFFTNNCWSFDMNIEDFEKLIYFDSDISFKFNFDLNISNDFDSNFFFFRTLEEEKRKNLCE